MKISKGFFFVGDSKGACIYKFSKLPVGFKEVDVLGRNGKLISTCCGILCFDIDAKGDVVVANLGRHQVTVLNEKGTAFKSSWGKGSDKVEDFCGCCNPVSLAVSAEGTIVTAEKTIPRLKLYSSDGRKLLGITSTEDFDKGCANLVVDIDSKKTIYAVDGRSNKIKVFSLPEIGK